MNDDDVCYKQEIAFQMGNQLTFRKERISN